MKSHYSKEVNGLAMHPRGDEFATVGRDNLLCIWSSKQRRQLKFSRLESAADSIAYSEDGKLLAIGLRSGYLLVVDQEFKPVAKVQCNKSGHGITVVQFFKDMCAVGDSEGIIRVYNSMPITHGDKVKKPFKNCEVIKHRQSAIIHIDFSESGEFLMVNNVDEEVFFVRTKGVKEEKPEGRINQRYIGAGLSKSSYHESDFKQFTETVWHTTTCTYGWATQGIFSANTSGHDVNAVTRSKNHDVIATGDDFGRINLFQYPCYLKDALFSTSLGHSSHVSNVQFCNEVRGSDVATLISTGSSDLCVFQWRFQFDPENDGDDGEVQQSSMKKEDNEGVSKQMNKVEQHLSSW